MDGFRIQKFGVDPDPLLKRDIGFEPFQVVRADDEQRARFDPSNIAPYGLIKILPRLQPAWPCGL